MNGVARAKLISEYIIIMYSPVSAPSVVPDVGLIEVIGSEIV